MMNHDESDTSSFMSFYYGYFILPNVKQPYRIQLKNSRQQK
jgi:hypothetical protein